jgi:hypothetical protein
MPRWTVYTRDEFDEVITASHLQITNGALVFLSDDMVPEIAYAPHTWNSVTRDEDD